MSSIERDAQGYNAGGWSNADFALHDGAPGYASVLAENEVFQLYAFDVETIPPSGVSVAGFEVVLDAWKDETSGSGTLRVGVELSWDDGSTYTTTTNKTGNLTTSEASYTLGGATNTWGRSWTRDELDHLRIRVKAQSAGDVLDTPEWRVDHVAIVVYWASTSTLTLSLYEQLPLVDRETISSQSLRIDETLGLADGGLTPQSEWVDLA